MILASYRFINVISSTSHFFNSTIYGQSMLLVAMITSMASYHNRRALIGDQNIIVQDLLFSHNISRMSICPSILHARGYAIHWVFSVCNNIRRLMWKWSYSFIFQRIKFTSLSSPIHRLKLSELVKLRDNYICSYILNRMACSY